jgi:hypothetical protein
MRKFNEYVIYNNVTPKAITSSTDATPIVVTANTHGFANGDLVLVYGHSTNVAANGIRKVANKTANTFELVDIDTGANIAGSGAGAGSGGYVLAAPKVIFAEDFTHSVVTVVTSGTATMTLKVAGSLGKITEVNHLDVPNFGATVSASNPYNFLSIVDLDTNAVTEGSAGIVVAGTDVHKTYEINVNAIKYFTLIPTAWTQGAINAKVVVHTNE